MGKPLHTWMAAALLTALVLACGTPEAPPEPGPDAGTQLDGGMQPEPDGGTQPEPEPDAGTQPEPDAGTQPEPEPDAGTQPEPDAGTQPQPEPEPDAGTQPEPDGGTQPEPDGGTPPEGSAAILLQGFHWNSASATQPGWYKRVEARAEEVGAMGFSHVWLPPPSNSAAVEGYLPRQLYVFDSAYGTETELRAVTGALEAAGVKAVADVVINHRVGTWGWGDFTLPTWEASAVVSDDEWGQGTGAEDSGDAYSAARDLDHSNAKVQEDLKEWMGVRLKGLGFRGLRFDYSKGYAPGYAKLYAEAFGPDFCVGEIWTDLDYTQVDAHRRKLLEYVEGTAGVCAAFDFTTKGLLNRALAHGEYERLKDAAGKPGGAIGLRPGRAVTFVDNHDTGPSESCSSGQNHWPVPCDKVMQGYAYILTHPGVPTVYWAHVYDWQLKGPIEALMAVRRGQGLTSTSEVEIQRAERGLYAAVVGGNTAVKLGPTSWSPGAGWRLATSGADWAVWTKGEGCTVPVGFSIANANTTLGQELYVVGDVPELGNWTPASGFKLTIEGSGANATWSGTVALPASTAVQYKYVKWNGTTAVWEGDQATTSRNREFTTPACGGTGARADGDFKF